MIRIVNLRKVFPGQNSLLNIKSVHFPKRGLVAILGHSGSGKSTLLKLIAGLDEEYEGQILIQNQSLKVFSTYELSAYRAEHIGFIFQDFQLLPLDSIRDNILLPLHYLKAVDQEDQNLLVDELLKLVDLPIDDRRNITALSGGEKQRVAIARSLVHNPDFILADEPTGSLDKKHKRKIMELLKTISGDKLVLMVSHDRELVEEFADIIYELEKGDLVLKKDSDLHKTNCKNLSFLRLPEQRPRFHLPFSFIFRHHFKTFQHKKGRTIIAEFALSLGLLALGLSFLITSSVTSQIQMMLASLFEDHQLLVTARYPSSSNEAIKAASLSEAKAIRDMYPNDVQRIGVHYQANFEEFFPDNNRLIVANSGVKTELSSFNMRNVNNYIWPNEDDGRLVNLPQIMEDDQLILGLPIADFQSLISALYLLPLTTYEELNQHLDEHQVFVAFEVKNESWQYEDAQLFQLIGCYQSLNPEIVHTNPVWNEMVFEEAMRLKATNNFTDPVALPWTMRKTYFLEVKDASFFLETMIQNPIFNRYLFNPLPLDNEEKITPRIGLFYQKENALSFAYLDYILNSSSDLLHYYPLSPGAYLAYPDALMVGFARTILFGASEEELLIVTENNLLDSELSSETELLFPSHVAVGSLKGVGSDNVRFSSNMNALLNGKKPSSLEEIIISTALADKIFGHHQVVGESLYLAVSSLDVFQGETYRPNVFQFKQLKITGINADQQMFIYQTPTWLYTYFSLVLGIDGFLLQPQGFMLKTSENCQLEMVAENLNHQFPHLKFTIPNSELTKSVVRTTDQIEKMILLVASLAIVIAFLLIMVVTYLTMVEEVNTKKLLHLVGVSSHEQERFFLFLAPMIGGLSLIIATLELIAMQFVLQKVLASYFHTAGTISFYLTPLAIMFITAFVLSLVSGKIVSALFKYRFSHRKGQSQKNFPTNFLKAPR